MRSYGASFDMMIGPEAANMPPTPWQTEILAPGICRGGDAAHLAHALLQYVHAGMHVGEAAAIGVERIPGRLALRAVPGTPGAVLRSAMKAPASPRGTKPKSSRP
jgi:hypothetical protein